MTRKISTLPNLVRHDAPGFVAVEDAGAYNIRFTVSWNLNGNADSASTDEYEAGQWRNIKVPAGATGVRVKIEGLVFYPIDDFPFVDLDWRTLRNEPVSSPTSACYKTTGTASIGDHGQGATSCGGSAFPDSSGSLSYSFDLGEYHFVQLQNWPGYTDTMDAVATLEDVFTFGTSGSPGFTVTSSYAWLTNDLRRRPRPARTSSSTCTTRNGCCRRSPPPTRTRSTPPSATRTSSASSQATSTRLAGQRFAINNGVHEIPVWYSASAECATFLYVDFHRRYYNVAVIDGEGGAPEFLASGWTCDTFGRYATNQATQGVIRTVDLDRAPRIILGMPVLPPHLEGRPVLFTSSSTDPDGDSFPLSWTFGDGGTATGSTPTHTYADDGTYTVQITADDGFGGVATLFVPDHDRERRPDVHGRRRGDRRGRAHAADGHDLRPGHHREVRRHGRLARRWAPRAAPAAAGRRDDVLRHAPLP